MLYDHRGQPIAETMAPPPRPGRHTAWEESDQGWLAQVGRGLDPETVDRIMRAADAGDTAEMCALCEAIDDRSFGIGAALDTRRAAIAATPWKTIPGDESARADEIAAAAGEMLRATRPGDDLLTFGQAVHLELGSALLPGFAAPEIVWDKGGAGILGFASVPQKHFTFRNSRPLLVTTDHPEGIELPPHKFLVHWHRAKGGTATRGGLVRACAWLRAFESLGYKDLLRFIERYGMPFLVAKVDEQSWKNERHVLRTIVRNFGPDGGAVLSRNTEIDLLQAANSDGEVYFRLVERLDQAAEKLILGQTATSGEGGWSNSGAQHLVRMDIRDSDCAQIAESVYARILVPWTAWNYGPDAPAPRIEYEIAEAKDAQAEATVVQTLGAAGWDLDPEQVEANTGYKVTRKPAQPAGFALSAEDLHGLRNLIAGTVQPPRNTLALAASPGTAEPRLGLSPDPADLVAGAAVPEARRAIGGLFRPLQERLDGIAAIEDPAAFRAACAALAAESAELLDSLDFAPLEDVLSRTIVAAAAAGKAEAAARIGGAR